MLMNLTLMTKEEAIQKIKELKKKALKYEKSVEKLAKSSETVANSIEELMAEKQRKEAVQN